MAYGEICKNHINYRYSVARGVIYDKKFLFRLYSSRNYSSKEGVLETQRNL